MTIRTKILIIIGLWLRLMPALLYVTSRFTFIRSLEEIEANHSSTDIEIALSAFSYREPVVMSVR